jgi:glycosyltransferase involved in cell wall biosynthesis
MIEVSIIIPTYNYSQYIEDTIGSLLQQTFDAWECLIIDNGSTDKTYEIVKTYLTKDSRLKYFFISHTTTSEARNIGLKNAKGQFIQFLDSDDLLNPNKLKIHVDFLLANPNIDLVFSDSVYFDDSDKERTQLRKTRNLDSIEGKITYSGQSWHLLHLMNSKNIWTICSPMFRKSILYSSGLFNAKLNWVEDWEFYFRLIAQNIQIKYIDNESSTCLIRVHQRSLSHQNLSMYNQSIVARKFIKQTLKKIKLNGFNETDELLQINSKQIIYLYKLKFNYFLKEKKIFYAFFNGIIISLKLKDYKYLLKTVLDFVLYKMKPIEL